MPTNKSDKPSVMSLFGEVAKIETNKTKLPSFEKPLRFLIANVGACLAKQFKASVFC